MRYLLVVNPASGRGHYLPHLQKAVRFFRKKGDEVVVYQTKGPGDGTRVVLERRDEGFDGVIAAGGDGTLREVIAGLSGTSLPLGVFPWGTGNVFAREMALPRRTKALCRVIRRGRTKLLDVGLADGHPFLMMTSVGLDAYALKTLHSGGFKRFWGVAAYALAGLRALVRYRHLPIEVRLDDGTRDRGTFVLVSNTRLYGAYFIFHPQANPTDGLLDVLVYRDSGRWRFLGMVAQMVWRGMGARPPLGPPRFFANHGVYRVKSLQLLPGNRPAQSDGEFLPGGVRSIGIAPGALRVFLP